MTLSSARGAQKPEAWVALSANRSVFLNEDGEGADINGVGAEPQYMVSSAEMLRGLIVLAPSPAWGDATLFAHEGQ